MIIFQKHQVVSLASLGQERPRASQGLDLVHSSSSPHRVPAPAPTGWQSEEARSARPDLGLEVPPGTAQRSLHTLSD